MTRVVELVDTKDGVIDLAEHIVDTRTRLEYLNDRLDHQAEKLNAVAHKAVTAVDQLTAERDALKAEVEAMGRNRNFGPDDRITELKADNDRLRAKLAECSEERREQTRKAMDRGNKNLELRTQLTELREAAEAFHQLGTECGCRKCAWCKLRAVLAKVSS